MDYQFRDITGLAKILKVLLIVQAAWSLVQGFSGWLQFELLEQVHFSVLEARANDVRERVISIIFLTFYLPTAIVFGRWIFRANQNARALGARA